jgi:hypothetical protein
MLLKNWNKLKSIDAEGRRIGERGSNGSEDVNREKIDELLMSAIFFNLPFNQLHKE